MATTAKPRKLRCVQPLSSAKPLHKNGITKFVKKKKEKKKLPILCNSAASSL